MTSKTILRFCLFSAAVIASVGALGVTDAGGPKFKGTWTDVTDRTLPEDFKFQGEFVGTFDNGGKLGAQVIALGQGWFQAVLCIGGLPGDGWDGKTKILVQGQRDGNKATFNPPTGKRKYIAQKAEEFSATTKFPPAGQKDCSAVINGEVLKGNTNDGQKFELKKIVRKSPTLEKKPPEGAVVLFNGTTTAAFKAGRVDKERGILHTDGKDITTKQKFMNYTIHLEFMLPYRPDARGQERGNSGFYNVNHYEVQILDSFGLDGKNNECGAIYQKHTPKVNMCLPPLQWQTYDIDFTNAVLDPKGKIVSNARTSMWHNGVLIHDNIELTGKTGGASNEPVGTPGVLLIQGHGNPMQFRNIWLVEK